MNDTSTRNQDIYEQFQQGKSICELAFLFNVSRQRIMQIVNKTSKKNGGKKRKRLLVGRPRIEIPPNLVEVYRQGKINQRQIAEELKCSTCTVMKRLKGIPKSRSTRERDIYRAFASGLTLKQVAEQFETTVAFVGFACTRQRSKEKDPYYRLKRKS